MLFMFPVCPSPGKQKIAIRFFPFFFPAIEIKRSGSGWNVDDPSFHVNGHPSPAVHASYFFVRIFWPCIPTRFTGLWYSMESPDRLSRAYVIGPDKTGGAIIPFPHSGTLNEDIFNHYSQR